MKAMFFACGALLLPGIAATSADASSVSGNLAVQITIGNGCTVGNSTVTGNVNNFGTIDFGTQVAPIVNYIDAQSTGAAGSTISVTCTSGVGYTVALDGGLNADGSTRRMSNGAAYVPYALYQEASRSTAWGDGGTYGSVLTGTGTGASEALTVYGRVPPDATASLDAGVYTDTVLVTVNW